ncbi:MAG: FAD-dependent monooxygenase [Bdellovibrionota bacterium]
MPARTRLNCDVAILGASLAGSAAARELETSGAEVLVIDARSFPREKPCGEGLSHHGVQILSDLGCNIKDLAHCPLHGYRIVRGGREAYIPLVDSSGNAGAGVGIRRSVLDTAVLDLAAGQKNTRTLLGSKVRRCHSDGNGFRIELASGCVIGARFVIDASGARRVTEEGSSSQGLPQRYASTSHYLCDRPHGLREVQILVERGFEVFVTPVSADILNVSLLASKSVFHELCRDQGRESVRRIVAGRLGIRLEDSSGLLCTGPVGNRRRSATKPGMFFVGDACEQFDPIGGMGMTHAVLSGRLAGQMLTHTLRGELPFRTAADRYDRLRSDAARPLRGFTRLTYLMLVALGPARVSSALASSAVARQVSRAVHRIDDKPVTKLSEKIIELAGL